MLLSLRLADACIVQINMITRWDCMSHCVILHIYSSEFLVYLRHFPGVLSNVAVYVSGVLSGDAVCDFSILPSDAVCVYFFIPI